MAWPIVGKSFTPAEFETYVRGLEWTDAFRPQFITLHNTASPSLAQRPNGLTAQHIKNLASYYQSKGWSGGPHLFVDDRQIWCFNDLTKRGTHSPSWNGCAIGIEMLGDFDTESFTEGRGRKVRDNTMAAVAILSKALGFAADSFKFHCEDKRTDHACPGRHARDERAAIVSEITVAMQSGGDHPVAVADADSLPLDVDATKTTAAALLDTSERNFAKINALAAQGSRLAGALRGFKNWFWKLFFGVPTIGAGASTLVNPNKGTGAVAAAHPHLLWMLAGVAAGALLIGLAAYLYVKFRVEPGLISAANDKRYNPKGA